MRDAATLGCLLFLLASTGCRWSTEVDDFASAIAQPTEADLVDPPETQPLTCTDEGFTIVVGPEPGCASLEGIAGGGEVASEALFRDPFSPMSVPTSPSATPIRVIRRGDRVADVEVILRCRPFFNDAREGLLHVHRGSCDVGDQVVGADCGFGGRFDETLDEESVLELRLAGDGTVVDVRACVRPDP